MSLWSLTKERVEKLLRQIGEIEAEVDTLIKLTKEDLWKKDLDLFIEEWRTQLEEEHQRKRRINNMGRRTSTKVKVAASGPTAKKRKGLGDYDDDDFEDRPKAKKPAAPKVNRKEVYVPKPVQKPSQSLISAFTASGQSSHGKDGVRTHDGASSDPEPEAKSAAAATDAGVKKAKPTVKSKAVAVPDDPDEEEMVKKPGARRARAAASKPIRYEDGSDSDGSNGDDLLGDITNMVKGLPGGESKPSKDAKSLFLASRSVGNGSSSLKPTPSVAAKKYTEISDDDDTNFLGLVPQHSPRRSINVTKNALLTDDEDEDEEDVRPLTTHKGRTQAIQNPNPGVPAATTIESLDSSEDEPIKSKPNPAKSSKVAASSSKATKAAPKAASKPPAAAATKQDPAPKKSKAPAPAKKPVLSPAAKAYAAKQAKNVVRKKTKLLDTDDEDEAIDAMADDLLDSPIASPSAGQNRHGRDDDGSESKPSHPKTSTATAAKITGAARPPRRAAAAAAKKKPVYVVSDDDDDDENEEDGDDRDSLDDEVGARGATKASRKAATRKTRPSTSVDDDDDDDSVAEEEEEEEEEEEDEDDDFED
ncbi:hypothetical protein HC762_02000 [bacterium]|nr:hypothetical protein [bacterium]